MQAPRLNVQQCIRPALVALGVLGLAAAQLSAQGPTPTPGDSLSGLGHRASASHAPSQPPAPQPKAPAEFRNLRYEEQWSAADRTPHWDGRIKAIPLASGVTLSVAGQARWRWETYRHFNLTAQDDDNAQSRLLLSAALGAGPRAGWHAQLFAEGRDAQSYGRTLPGGARPQDQDRHDWQNLFAAVAYGPSVLRVGRQEVSMNRDRLFGVPDWTSTRKSVDGARLQLVHGAFALDVMDARPVTVRQMAPNRADSTLRFHTVGLGSAPGATALRPGLPATWQVYWYEQEGRTITQLTRRQTLGGRAQWALPSPSTRPLTLDVEGGVQRGHANTSTIAAWYGIAELQGQLKRVRGAPSLALGVEAASGDQAATTTRLEAFVTPYPAAHSHGGYADLVGRGNLRELHAIGTWDPVAALSLRAAAYRFDRVRADDGVYTKSNAVLRSAGGSPYHHAADELDVTGTWKVTRHLRVVFGGAVVRAGAFFLSTPGGGKHEMWAFTGTTFTF